MEYTFEFSKAMIYINSKKKSLSAIKSETGCDVIINGGLFNMNTFKPVCHLKADGKLYAKDQYRYWGYGWDNADTNLQMVNTYDSLDNYICCSALVKDGKKTTLFNDPATSGKRGRTVLGTLPNGKTIIFCSKDGTKDAKTPKEMQQYCLSAGWKDAVMLDSGGSSQCITPTGKITSTRKVHNVLCFWLRKTDNEPKGEKPMVEINAYSLKTDGNKSLTAHFKVKEFACQDGSDTIFIARELPMVCEYIRMRCNKGITVNSGYRTPTHNKKVGGVDNSQHCYGTAADLKTPSGWTPKKMASIAREIMPNWGGVGIYDWGIHVDVREKKSDWNG